MKRINLVYWNEDNLGDYLSPYIINKLSGLSIKHKNYYFLGKRGQLGLFILFLRGKLKWKELTENLFFFEKSILGVGSIISYGNKRSYIWGSGFMNYDEPFRGGKVLAVRGKLTNERIFECGYKGCNIFGDPALLLPLFLKSSQEEKYELGIIPHWTEYDYFYNKYGKYYKVIDIRTKNVEQFVSQLTSCKYILSSSLHGIIISHAYNIPALWIKHGYIDTDGFKFYDYFSSVDIPFYDGFYENENILNSEKWMSLFTDYEKLSLPAIDISLIQKGLLSVVPFDLLPKYKLLL